MIHIFYLRKGSVNKIYQHTEYSDIWQKDCRSTVVLVDNAPLSRYAQEKLQQKNSKEIIENWNPFTDECDDVLFVNNKIGRIKRSGDIKYWIADDAICLKGIIDGCISWDDRLFYVGFRKSILSSEITGGVNGRFIYIRFVNDQICFTVRMCKQTRFRSP